MKDARHREGGRPLCEPGAGGQKSTGNTSHANVALEGAVVGSGSEWLFLSFCVYFVFYYILFTWGEVVSVPWPKERCEERTDSAKLPSGLTRAHNNKLIISTHELPSILFPEHSTACLPCSSHSPLCCSLSTPFRFIPGSLKASSSRASFLCHLL